MYNLGLYLWMAGVLWACILSALASDGLRSPFLITLFPRLCLLQMVRGAEVEPFLLVTPESSQWYKVSTRTSCPARGGWRVMLSALHAYGLLVVHPSGMMLRSCCWTS